MSRELDDSTREAYKHAMNKSSACSLGMKDYLPTTEDNPIEPSHYTDLAISPLEYIEANQEEFDWSIANVIKYVSRYKRKNGIEDLKKAQWYLNHQIALEEKKLES